VYVREIAVRLGEEYDLVTRNPMTNETFQASFSVKPLIRDLIARRWGRAEAERRAYGGERPLVDLKSGFDGNDDEDPSKRARLIEKMWADLKNYGIDIGIEQANVAAPFSEHKVKDDREMAPQASEIA
jgi:hypothetical protein